MQYSIRTILIVTVFISVAFCFWPDPERGPKSGYYLFVALTACLVVSLLLGDSAWRNARNRAKSADGLQSSREKLACQLVVDVPVALLWYASMYLYVPAALCLVGSFWLFFGANLNRPLMAIRLIWLVMIVFVPFVIYYFILPRLG